MLELNFQQKQVIYTMPIYLIPPYINTSILYILSKYVILLLSHFKRSSKTEFFFSFFFFHLLHPISPSPVLLQLSLSGPSAQPS